jgi:hypothetical protein
MGAMQIRDGRICAIVQRHRTTMVYDRLSSVAAIFEVEVIPKVKMVRDTEDTLRRGAGPVAHCTTTTQQPKDGGRLV